jgi:hypothetical protein
MNHTRMGSETADLAEDLFRIPESLRSLILPHVLVGLLFIILLRSKTTYLPLSVPAVLLASYHEWALHIRDGTSTVRYSILGLLIPWGATFTYRLVTRRMLLGKMVRSHPLVLSTPQNHHQLIESI